MKNCLIFIEISRNMSNNKFIQYLTMILNIKDHYSYD